MKTFELEQLRAPQRRLAYEVTNTDVVPSWKRKALRAAAATEATLPPPPPGVMMGASNGWKMDEVMPSSEIIARIGSEFPLQQIDPNYVGETAGRWRYADGSGEIGVISSVTQAFCQDCSRARLSTEGKLFTCLFATSGHDLRALMRAGHSDAEISAAIGQVWHKRTDRYSELRSADTVGLPRSANKVEMSYIGG